MVVEHPTKQLTPQEPSLLPAGQGVSLRAHPWLASGWVRLLLLFLILLAFGRVMWQLDAKNLWWDETLSLQRAESNWVDLILGRLYLYDGLTSDLTHDQHPFFFFVLQGILVRLAGDSEIVLRFPSVMAVTLLVGVVVSLVQALTQIQEQTLIYVPKIVAVFGVMLLMLPFIGDAMAAYMARIAARIAAGG